MKTLKQYEREYKDKHAARMMWSTNKIEDARRTRYETPNVQVIQNG